MNELIKVSNTNFDGEQKQTVSARELHKYLESKQDFSTWIKVRIDQYGFVENQDFVCFHKKMEANNATLIEYFLSLDMAKELSMVERNAQGKKARQYFIECERIAKEPKPLTLEQLLHHNVMMIENLNQKVITLETTIQKEKPMTDFGKAVSGSSAAVLIGDWIKAIAEQGMNIGRNKVFEWFRNKGYLMSSNIPYQQYVNQGLFEVKESLVATPKGQKINFTTLLTGKGQVYFANKLKTDLAGV